jgi:hypothetical protein
MKIEHKKFNKGPVTPFLFKFFDLLEKLARTINLIAA